MKKITLIIVEDHKLLREMWVQLLAVKQEIEVVGESGEFNEAVEMIKQKRPDIVLLDINLPPASGMDAVPLIRRFTPGTKIIAVSTHNQPAYAKKMLQLGAMGYVTKNSSGKEVLAAISEVMNGNKYLCSEIRESIAAQTLQYNTPVHNDQDLSLREIQIIQLIKEGHPSKEIADSLYISIRTVEVHRRNILKKLKLKNTASLIAYANNTDLFM